jgi:hypothetical protein
LHLGNGVAQQHPNGAFQPAILSPPHVQQHDAEKKAVDGNVL